MGVSRLATTSAPSLAILVDYEMDSVQVLVVDRRRLGRESRACRVSGWRGVWFT